MKLFLSGGGKDPFKLDELFLESLDKSKPVLYIPIAMDENKHFYPECLGWIKNYFSKFGFDSFDMQTDLSRIENFENYSGVYIGGGNTPFLLKEMKESGFFEKLKKAIKDGLPVAGGSAGAIIHAKTIIPALYFDENKVGLEDFSVFDNLGGYEIWPHYNPEMDSIILDFITKNNVKKVIAIPEHCGIYVNEDKMQIIGNSSAWIFDKEGNKREVKNEEYFK